MPAALVINKLILPKLNCLPSLAPLLTTTTTTTTSTRTYAQALPLARLSIKSSSSSSGGSSTHNNGSYCSTINSTTSSSRQYSIIAVKPKTHIVSHYTSQNRLDSIIRSKMSSYAQHMFADASEKEDALRSVCKSNWVKCTEKDAIRKSFTFRNFIQAFSFMTAVALESEKIDHHPEWSNVYNKVEITLTSHFCNGVSLLDIKLARIIDNIYASTAKE